MEAWKLFMLTMQVICTKYRFVWRTQVRTANFHVILNFFYIFSEWNSEWLPDVLLAKTVERKAINLLNHPTALGPSYRLLQKKRRVISAAGRSTQETLKITISARSLAKCGCTSFKFPIFTVILLLLQKKNEY